MRRDQIGELEVNLLKSAAPAWSNDADLFPGMPQKWGLSFDINTRRARGLIRSRAAQEVTIAGLCGVFVALRIRATGRRRTVHARAFSLDALPKLAVCMKRAKYTTADPVAIASLLGLLGIFALPYVEGIERWATVRSLGIVTMIPFLLGRSPAVRFTTPSKAAPRPAAGFRCGRPPLVPWHPARRSHARAPSRVAV